MEACPIHQDVPEYVHLAGAGRMAEAFEAVYLRNPLPFMTGYLCDHQCMENCTRMDWEGAVQIREMKRIAAEKGFEAFRSGARAPVAHGAVPRGTKVAVLGAGPAGLAAASFLCREGFEVHVFEREKEPGGIVRYLLPGFRIPAGAVEKDVALLREMGAHFHFGQEPARSMSSRPRGSPMCCVGVGAESAPGCRHRRRARRAVLPPGVPAGRLAPAAGQDRGRHRRRGHRHGRGARRAEVPRRGRGPHRLSAGRARDARVPRGVSLRPGGGDRVPLPPRARELDGRLGPAVPGHGAGRGGFDRQVPSRCHRRTPRRFRPTR